MTQRLLWVPLACAIPLCQTATGQQVCAPPTTLERPPAFFKGMLAWWPATGNYNDIIGGNNGTPNGAVTFAPGEVGQAFSLIGGSYVDVGNPASLNIPGSITVEAWVNPTTAGDDVFHTIFSEMSSSNNLGEVELRINGSSNGNFTPGTFGFRRRPTNGSVASEGISTTKMVTPGTWHHVAATFDGSNYLIYFDGQPDLGGSIGGEDIEPTGPDFKIGQDNSLVQPFDGLIDELSIYNRALSAAEIQATYNAGTAGLCPQARFARPTLMGVSIGNTTGTASGCTEGCNTGTAGLLVYSVKDPSLTYILSNSHVIGAVGPSNCPGSAPKGTWTLQPGTYDIKGGDPGQVPYFHVGWVAASWPLSTTGHNTIDAAISETTTPLASTEIFGIGQPNPAVGTATLGETVTKSGRTTGVTVGTVATINVAGTVTYAGSCGSYMFEGQIGVSPKSWETHGDSGAAVLDSSTLTPVGLNFAHSPSLPLALANPISAVFDKLQIFPVSPSGAGPRSAAELQAILDSLESRVDPRIKHLMDIQSRHQDELLGMPGVNGIGIGLDESNTAFVFHVYITKHTDETERSLPKQLEGVPVRLIETGGPFQAL